MENNNEVLKKLNNYREEIKRKEMEERKNRERNNEEKEINKCIMSEKKRKNIVVRFSGKDFKVFVRPIIYSWLYLAKQFTFLKNII
jgi:siroheme synthase